MSRSGQWIDPPELIQRALDLLEECENADGEQARDLILDLSGLDYLDTSALQVLLAIRAEQLRRGGGLTLLHASGTLKQWFRYAGIAELLAPEAGSGDSEPSGGITHAQNSDC